MAQTNGTMTDGNITVGNDGGTVQGVVGAREVVIENMTFYGPLPQAQPPRESDEGAIPPRPDPGTHFVTFLREHVSHWTVTGTIAALTGASPEHWYENALKHVGVTELSIRWTSAFNWPALLTALGLAVVLWDLLRPRAQQFSENPAAHDGGLSPRKSSAHVVHLPFFLIFGLLLAPVALAFTDIAPPLSRGITLVTSLGEAVSLFVAWHLLQKLKIIEVKRVMKITAVALAIGAFLYLAVDSFYTYEDTSIQAKRVKGFQCTENAIKVYGTRCPNLGTEEIERAGRNPEELWTPSSIAAIKTTINLLWLFTFSALSVIAACIMSLSESKKSHGRRFRPHSSSKSARVSGSRANE
jgi:hypothetical protein